MTNNGSDSTRAPWWRLGCKLELIFNTQSINVRPDDIPLPQQYGATPSHCKWPGLDKVHQLLAGIDRKPPNVWLSICRRGNCWNWSTVAYLVGLLHWMTFFIHHKCEIKCWAFFVVKKSKKADDLIDQSLDNLNPIVSELSGQIVERQIGFGHLRQANLQVSGSIWCVGVVEHRGAFYVWSNWLPVVCKWYYFHSAIDSSSKITSERGLFSRYKVSFWKCCVAWV